MTRTACTTAVAALVVVTLTMPVQAGPPLICHPFQIDDNAVPGGKDLGEVLARLDGDTPVLVRMETLRRATIACGRDNDAARALLAALMARALDAEAAGRKDSTAWFDVGFTAQSMHQNDLSCVKNLGVADGIVGYAWVSRAIELGSDDPQMHFAAALVTALDDGRLSGEHLKIATAGATGDRLLSVNIERFRNGLGEHLDHSRRNHASSRRH